VLGTYAAAGLHSGCACVCAATRTASACMSVESGCPTARGLLLLVVTRACQPWSIRIFAADAADLQHCCTTAGDAVKVVITSYAEKNIQSIS
jgi:hypothetical protein